MQSISKEAYEYFNALQAQIKNDGGALSPTPATPPGNFSNGALGFFKVVAIRRKTIAIQ